MFLFLITSTRHYITSLCCQRVCCHTLGYKLPRMQFVVEKRIPVNNMKTENFELFSYSSLTHTSSSKLIYLTKNNEWVNSEIVQNALYFYSAESEFVMKKTIDGFLLNIIM